MPGDPAFQRAAAAFVPVQAHYDGLNGSIIKWSLEHGNDNHDPSVLAWIIDPSGEVLAQAPAGVVYQAAGFAKWLDAHAGASFPLVDPAAYPHCAREAAAVAARRKLGATLATLRGWAADAADPARQAEAAQLVAKVQAYADWKRDRAIAKQTSDPPGALALWAELAREFAGDTVGEDATATLEGLKQDPAFQAECKAADLLARALAVAEPRRPHGAPDPALRRKAAGVLVALRKKYPGTRAAARATALLEAWGLE